MCSFIVHANYVPFLNSGGKFDETNMRMGFGGVAIGKKMVKKGEKNVIVTAVESMLIRVGFMNSSCE